MFLLSKSHYSPVTSSLLGPNIYLRNLFSKNPLPSLDMGDQTLITRRIP
jgi:hypothetical protein